MGHQPIEHHTSKGGYKIFWNYEWITEMYNINLKKTLIGRINNKNYGGLISKKIEK